MKQNLKHEIIKELLRKFPDAPTLQIARMVYKANKSLFPTLEAVRTRVRYLRGATGQKQANSLLDKSFIKKGKLGDPFAALPEGITQFKSWESYKLPGRRNTLVLADVHIPFHDKAALMAAISYGKKNAVDTVLLNGDTSDFFSVSFWEKDPRQRDFKNELENVKSFLQALREKFPKAEIIYKLGNHEERWERYMRVKAPELLGIEKFELPALLEFKESGVTLVQDKRPIEIGELNVIHGHEYRFAIANPVNPARGLFLRCKAYALCGHFHQSSYHTEKTVEQKVIATWSTGCLCDLHPEYMPMNNWCHGFAFVESYENGKFNLQNKVVRNGKIY